MGSAMASSVKKSQTIRSKLLDVKKAPGDRALLRSFRQNNSQWTKLHSEVIQSFEPQEKTTIVNDFGKPQDEFKALRFPKRTKESGDSKSKLRNIGPTQAGGRTARNLGKKRPIIMIGTSFKLITIVRGWLNG